ncbi:PEP phosphonomutase [Thermicanus aegyptius]|uniref:DUF7916 family protein n=1 Tax=Thermicanus aegyptius TaxID=94009 RepID=UPI0006941FD0
MKKTGVQKEWKKVTKRILDCRASDFSAMTGQDLKRSIQAAEGRTLLAEVISAVPPLYPGVTNAEVAAAFGADLILLNFFDFFHPGIEGLEGVEPERVIFRLKEMIGRPVGVNLEPVDPDAKPLESLLSLPEGRMASEKSLERAKELGVDFICLTGNPKTGVTNGEIAKAIRKARRILGKDSLIIAGKMHGAGVEGETGAEILSRNVLEEFIEAGADVVLLPSPGTVPGITLEKASKWVEWVHEGGALAMLATGTSQEGSDSETIREIAIMSKMAGADLYHIGDAGFAGIAVPENIKTYSIAIRGIRHTYLRMAASPLR